MNPTTSAVFLLILRGLLAAALYGFLALALWTMWREMKRQAELTIARQTPPLTLERAGAQENWRIRGQLATLGRDERCECCIEDPTVSTRHARLSYHHGQWWVEDLHSTNGTTLNDQPVEEPAVLTSGDALRCGQVILQVRIE